MHYFNCNIFFQQDELSEKLSLLQSQDMFSNDNFLEGEWLEDNFGLADGTFRHAIPHKPPPPYTPPGTPQPTPPPDYQTARLELQRSYEPYSAVPRKWEEVAPLLDKVMVSAYEACSKGDAQAIQEVQIPEGYITQEDAGFDLVSKSQRVYKQFIFNLVKETCHDICSVRPVAHQLPWVKPKKASQKKQGLLTAKDVQDMVHPELADLLQVSQEPQKEVFSMKWGSRKRDFVDAILVQELRNEESEWLNYDEDELTVKMHLSDAIFTSLVDECGKICNEISKKRKSS